MKGKLTDLNIDLGNVSYNKGIYGGAFMLRNLFVYRAGKCSINQVTFEGNIGEYGGVIAVDSYNNRKSMIKFDSSSFLNNEATY